MENAIKNAVKKYTKLDCVAFILCAILFGYLLFVIHRGIGVPDESFYYTIVQRLMQGDRLLVDEWHVTQLSSILLYIPFKLYSMVTGGIEGVQLFMRYVYVFCSFCIYWFLYSKMRRFGGWGLAAVVFFTAYFFCIKTLSYVTMSIQGTAVFSALVFADSKKKSAFHLVFAGVVLSCTVLAQPFFALAYFVYSVLVFVYRLRSKKQTADPQYAFALNERNWLFISLGVLICFLVFIVVLQIKCGIDSIIKNIPELFTDSEYNFRLHGGRLELLRIKNARVLIGLYGKHLINGLMISWLLSYVYSKWYDRSNIKAKKNRNGKTAAQTGAEKRLALLCLSCGFFVSVYIHAFVVLISHDVSYAHDFDIYSSAVLSQAFPAMVFGWICINLCKEKDYCLRSLAVAALLLTLMADYTSDMVVGLGGSITVLGALPHFGRLLHEIRDDMTQMHWKRINRRRMLIRTVQGIITCCAVLFSIWTLTYLKKLDEGIVERYLFYDDATTPTSLNVQLNSGVYKGIYTSQKVKTNYENILADMETIKKNCKGTVYIAGLMTMPYLELDLPYGTFSTWYLVADSQTRIIRYWQMLPSRKPDYIYIPIEWYDSLRSGKQVSQAKEKAEFFREYCTFEQTSGNAGEILHVLSWDMQKIDAYEPSERNEG